MINVIIIAAIGGYAAYVVAKRVKDKKNGKSACGCGGGCGSCSGCDMAVSESVEKNQCDEEVGGCCSQCSEKE